MQTVKLFVKKYNDFPGITNDGNLYHRGFPRITTDKFVYRHGFSWNNK